MDDMFFFGQVILLTWPIIQAIYCFVNALSSFRKQNTKRSSVTAKAMAKTMTILPGAVLKTPPTMRR